MAECSVQGCVCASHFKLEPSLTPSLPGPWVPTEMTIRDQYRANDCDKEMEREGQWQREQRWSEEGINWKGRSECPTGAPSPRQGRP